MIVIPGAENMTPARCGRRGLRSARQLLEADSEVRDPIGCRGALPGTSRLRRLFCPFATEFDSNPLGVSCKKTTGIRVVGQCGLRVADIRQALRRSALSRHSPVVASFLQPAPIKVHDGRLVAARGMIPRWGDGFSAQ